MSTRVVLRTATPADAAAICAVVASRRDDVVDRPEAASAFLETLTLDATRERLASTSFRTVVADAGGAVVGVAVLRDLGHLYHLFVTPSWAGRGLGRRLWERAAAESRAAGYDGAFTVNASRNAVAVYRAFGFVPAASPVRADGLVYTPMRRPAEAGPAASA